MKHEISCSESGPSTPSKHPPYLTEQHSGKVKGGWGDYEVTPFLSSRIYGGGVGGEKRCEVSLSCWLGLLMPHDAATVKTPPENGCFDEINDGCTRLREHPP